MKGNGKHATLTATRSIQHTAMPKVAILAGGMASRLSEEAEGRPKPLIEIGGRPMLWHIMMGFSRYGFRDFVIALGYKGEQIKRYMLDYCSLNSDLSVDLRNGDVTRSGGADQDWTVELIDTGYDTMTGGRVKRLARHLGSGTFILVWGDGVTDLDLDALLAFHRSHGKLATLTAVRPTARFGRLRMSGDEVVEFAEKPQLDEGWISGGIFVCEPGVIDYIEGDDTHWEQGALERLADEGQLMAYRHYSFWQCLDTLRDKRLLESLWQSGEAPWKTWE